jgi:hypothetical protein
VSQPSALLAAQAAVLVCASRICLLVASSGVVPIAARCCLNIWVAAIAKKVLGPHGAQSKLTTAQEPFNMLTMNESAINSGHYHLIRGARGGVRRWCTDQGAH